MAPHAWLLAAAALLSLLLLRNCVNSFHSRRLLLTQIAFGPTTASGWFTVEAPSRNLRGRVIVEAERPGASDDEWDVKALSVEFDRAELDAANAQRDAVAVAAGYRGGEAGDAGRAAAGAAAPAAVGATGGPSTAQEEKVVITLL